MSTMIKSKLQDVKRELILEEAAKLFESAGFENLKVSDLAKSVGVSVGTIYGMFDSKEGLYLAYVQRQIAAYLDELDARCAQIDSPKEQLKTVFRIKFEHFASKRKAVEECARNNPLFFSNVRHSSPDIFERAYAKIAGIIGRVNPALDEEDALQLAYACVGLSDGYLSYWLAADHDLLRRVEPFFAQMMLLIEGKPCEV